MNWYKLTKFAEKTLYHGTIRDHASSIGEIGLIPQVGQFIQDAYGGDYAAAGLDIEDEITELSFAADKENINSTFTAMTHHISNKLKKTFHDVTENNIRNHGMIVKIKGSPGEDVPHSSWEQRPEDYNQDWEMDTSERGLRSVEPGDYYTEYGTGGLRSKEIELITGSALIRFLKRKGLIKSQLPSPKGEGLRSDP